jgi:hypothetical protein
MSYGKLTFTAAGYTTAAAGDIKLIRMPAGPVRIISGLSRIVCPAGTSTSDLDIGWSDYTSSTTGLTVTGDADGLAASLDVGGAAIDALLILPAVTFVVEINSASGFDIVCSFDTANSPASGVMHLNIVYQIGN